MATTTVACLSNAVLPATILLPNIVDGCGNSLQPTGPPQIIDAPSPITCQGTRTYQYTYVDCAGNTKTWSYIYTIAAPVVVMPANGASTVACPSDAVAPTPPAIIDNCGKAITPSAPVVSASPACAGTKTYTYTYIDCSGVARNWIYTYTIAPPTVTLPAPGGSIVACVANAVAPTPPAVVDNCGRVITPSAPVISADPVCAGTKTYTYTYTDCNGAPYNWVYTYTIAPPTVVLPAPGGSTVACVANAVAPTPPVVMDNCGRMITPAAPVVSC
jgi:hypothetical protein